MSGIAAGDIGSALFDVLVLLAVFGCVVLHEVGHALAARLYGIGTRDITLYPVGGVARLEGMPTRPLHEIVVALAGPAVNVAIAAGLLAGIVASNYVLPRHWSTQHMGVEEAFLARLFQANVFLCLFNLIPAFPMDGGRVLRAALNMGMPRPDATRVAVTIGSVLAACGFVFGMIEGQLTWMLLAGFVYMLGQGELAAVRAEERYTDRRRYAREVDEPAGGESPRPGGRPFTGWAWDPARRVWSEWRGGVLFRELPGV